MELWVQSMKFGVEGAYTEAQEHAEGQYAGNGRILRVHFDDS